MASPGRFSAIFTRADSLYASIAPGAAAMACCSNGSASAARPVLRSTRARPTLAAMRASGASMADRYAFSAAAMSPRASWAAPSAVAAAAPAPPATAASARVTASSPLPWRARALASATLGHGPAPSAATAASAVAIDSDMPRRS